MCSKPADAMNYANVHRLHYKHGFEFSVIILDCINQIFLRVKLYLSKVLLFDSTKVLLFSKQPGGVGEH